MAYKKKQAQQTLYWHDYETFGIDPQLDGVSQFAGIRTDLDFNEIGEPLDIFCIPTSDRLPAPEACLVTGISPYRHIQEGRGYNETSFFHQIEKELGKAGTCGVGYNSINFDDEVTRNGFYRNFIDPYAREWKDGCSRWDLLNVVRMMNAIQPGIINVPINEETGTKIFKLDQLSPANGIEHENAHEALSDVRATIKLAKMLKDGNPEVFDLLFSQRTKAGVADMLFSQFNANPKYGDSVLKQKPFIIADSYFGGVQDFIEVMYPVYSKGNNVYCVKLTKDLSKILEWDAETIKERLFAKKKPEEGFVAEAPRGAKVSEENQKTPVYLEDGEERIPLHTIAINKCPVILPVNHLTKETAEKIGVSGDKLRENIALIKANLEMISGKVKSVFDSPNYGDSDPDVDMLIYSGGFFSDTDKNHFANIKSTNSVDLLDYLRDTMKKKGFDDKKRVPEMVFRYIARNFESDLDPKAMGKWKEFCKERIEGDDNYSMNFSEYAERIAILREIHAGDEGKETVLDELVQYGEELKAKLGIE